jgi:hypothetical protein
VTKYVPAVLSATATLDMVQRYIVEELRKISETVPEQLQLLELHIAPQRPRSGMIVLADGTDWNPGNGQGYYGYYNSGWVKLG